MPIIERLFSSPLRANSTPAPDTPATPTSPPCSILRSPSNGHLPNGRSHHHQHRVSFSHDPPLQLEANNNNNTRLAVKSPATNGTSGGSSSTSWLRSIWSRSKSTPEPRQRKISTASTHSTASSFGSITSEEAETSFKPKNNADLVASLPLNLTTGPNGKQLRLLYKQEEAEATNLPEAGIDVINELLVASSLDDHQPQGLEYSSSLGATIKDTRPPLVQNAPFHLDNRRVGLLILNKDGVCGFTNIRNSPLELILKKLLLENIMEDVPKCTTTTNPLLRARASPAPTVPPLSPNEASLPSHLTTSLNHQSRSRTEPNTVRGVDPNALDLEVFYSTLSEMIFGSIELAASKRPSASSSSMIDTQYRSGAKLFAFKMHHLGTVWLDEAAKAQEDGEGDDLFVTSFIIDIVDAEISRTHYGLNLQVGVAVLWLCPQSRPIFSNASSGPLSPEVAELTLYNLLFNTPELMMRTLRHFASDLLAYGLKYIRPCFAKMLHRINEFTNALRLNGHLQAEEEVVDLLVHLIQRYDKKEHGFFTSNLLSTLLSYGYRQERFKVVLWSSKAAETLPMMCQVATLVSHFLCKAVHRISDDVVITEDYKFVIPPEVRGDFEKMFENRCDGNGEIDKQAAPKEEEDVVFEVAPSGSNNSEQLPMEKEPEAEPLPMIIHSDRITARRVSKCDRKSRDESIGYESLTESAISGNVSPVNGPEEEELDSGETSDGTSDSLLAGKEEQKQEAGQSNEEAPLLNVSQTTDYEEEMGVVRCDTGTTNASSTDDNAPSASATATLNKQRQSYFRGYVDLRYKEGSTRHASESDDTETLHGSSPRLPRTASFGSSPRGGGAGTGTGSDPIKFSCSQTSSDSLVTLMPGATSEEGINNNTSIESQIAPASAATSDIHPEAAEVQVIQTTPLRLVSLNTISQRTPPAKAALTESYSPSASSYYHYSWLSLPVITTHHLNHVTTQIILGPQSESNTPLPESSTDYPQTYEQLHQRLLTQLKDEECNDTIFLINCDNWKMALLERALAEPCGPVMSTFIANFCEKILFLAAIEHRKFTIWPYIRWSLSQLLLKSELLQSTLENDLYLLMRHRSDVAQTGSAADETEGGQLAIYMSTKVEEYAHKVRAELIGDQTTGIYLTSDGPKATFDLFRFRAPTSALYLFSDNALSWYYLPSDVTTKILDFDASDVPLIVGMRKQFLRSRGPLIRQLHGTETAPLFDYLLKWPVFPKNASVAPKVPGFFARRKRKGRYLYKTIPFNLLIAQVMPMKRRYRPRIATTVLSTIPENGIA